MTDLLDLTGRELDRELGRIIKSSKQRRRFWTEKEDSVLKRLYEAGTSYETMSKALGRSKMAVSLRLNHTSRKDTL